MWQHLKLRESTLNKATSTVTVESDKRGGRQSGEDNEADAFVHKTISDQKDKFPRVVSHYCRENSTKEYLSPNLS